MRTYVDDASFFFGPDGFPGPGPNAVWRRYALRLARLIEAGAPLLPGEVRETLVDCSRRPGRRPCLGLLWVKKLEDQRIYAVCPACQGERHFITRWELTDYAEGPMPPISGDELPPSRW